MRRPSVRPDGWRIVIPVKGTDAAKSRLLVPGIPRAPLARAIALDTIAAATGARSVAEIVVVTNDAVISDAASHLPRTRVIADPGGGIDAAVAAGVTTEPDPRFAFSPPGIAALLGDLPALRPGDLDTALTLAGAVSHGVVADADGVGSTMVTASGSAALRTAFGADSLVRHLALGAEPLGIAPDSTLRRDVDTLSHLRVAARSGLGPRTAQLLTAATA